MIAPRGLNIIELDRRASTQEQPIGIIAADCLNPREIDDGIFVEELPAAQEMYRVGICVADASKLYDNGDAFKQAMEYLNAEYWDNPDGTRGYKPMIPDELVRRHEFGAGRFKNAFILSFVIGDQQPMTDIDVRFGKVFVEKNLHYAQFNKKCRYNERYAKFGRAAAFIMKHLEYTSGGDEDTPITKRSAEDIHSRLVHIPGHLRARVGSDINEAYMVAAGHAAGKLMRDEERLAIFRVNDHQDRSALEFFSPEFAHFSTRPGPHDGLNLDVYSRVTSPLRRVEDFIMHRLFWLRANGLSVPKRDERVVLAAVQRLNCDVGKRALEGGVRLSPRDTFGATTEAERFQARYGGVVLPFAAELTTIEAEVAESKTEIAV